MKTLASRGTRPICVSRTDFPAREEMVGAWHVHALTIEKIDLLVPFEGTEEMDLPARHRQFRLERREWSTANRPRFHPSLRPRRQASLEGHPRESGLGRAPKPASRWRVASGTSCVIIQSRNTPAQQGHAAASLPADGLTGFPEIAPRVADENRGRMLHLSSSALESGVHKIPSALPRSARRPCSIECFPKNIG